MADKQAGKQWFKDVQVDRDLEVRGPTRLQGPVAMEAGLEIDGPLSAPDSSGPVPDGTAETSSTVLVVTADSAPDVSADETVTIGDETYTFKAEPSEPYEVAIGANDAESLANLADAIAFGGNGFEPHPDFTAEFDAPLSVIITAREPGASFDSTELDETMAQGAWDDPTPLGGQLIVVPTPTQLLPRRITLAVEDFRVYVGESDGFGHGVLFSLGTDAVVLASSADLTIVKDGVGYIAASDISVSIGTTVAAANAPDEGIFDTSLLGPDDLTDNELELELVMKTATGIRVSAAVEAGDIYLNVFGDTETSENAYVDVSGVVHLWVLDTAESTTEE
jgi:hypothetical protein